MMIYYYPPEEEGGDAVMKREDALCLSVCLSEPCVSKSERDCKVFTRLGRG